MRRLFHRKQQQARQSIANAPNGGTTNRLQGSPTNLSPRHLSTTGRVRAPALRSRSMTVLYGPDTDNARASGNKSNRFAISRSLSFSDDHPQVEPLPPTHKFLTQSEEDEMFKLYTRKLYLMFAIMSAIITGFVVYAYVYNTGQKP